MAQCGLFSRSPRFCTRDNSFLYQHNVEKKFVPVRKLQLQSTACSSSFRSNACSSTPSAPQLSSCCVKGPGHISMPFRKMSIKPGCANPTIQTISKRTISVNASSSDSPTYQGYPPMQTKPAWWWRLLACIPYLIPIHIAWIHAENTYDLHGLMEMYEWYTLPFLIFLGELPGWFFTFYFFVGYLGIVRENRWPHFFRCHMITGMLLEMTLEVCMTVGEFIPTIFIEGKLGMYIWFFISWTFLLTALGCLWCAIRGMYADVPFISKAAYIQVPF